PSARQARAGSPRRVFAGRVSFENQAEAGPIESLAGRIDPSSPDPQPVRPPAAAVRLPDGAIEGREPVPRETRRADQARRRASPQHLPPGSGGVADETRTEDALHRPRLLGPPPP